MRQHVTIASSGGRIRAKPVRGYRGAIQALVGVVLMLVVLEAVLIVVFRLQMQPAIDAVRRFNRAVLNPAMMKLAGSAHWYASVIYHQGRASGRSYATPVLVEQAGNHFYIPLPYGATDWSANVTAAGRCTIEHRGKLYHAAAPTIVPFPQVAPLISARLLRSFRLYNVRSFLRLDITGE
jgi:hypothetical protein